jgi:hypothetical protein
MPIIIKIFSGFCESQQCKEGFESAFQLHTFPNYGKDKEIYITTDDDYTHVIILNTAMPNLKNIPKENIVGLAYEPPIFLGLNQNFIEYTQKYINKYYIGDVYDLPPPFIQTYAFMLHNSPPSIIPDKKNIMSIMVSQKNMAPGHKYRHILVQHILQYNLPIDIYGRGCPIYDNFNEGDIPKINKNERASQDLFFRLKTQNKDKRIKGVFEETEPYATYNFHICIENFSTSEYFSEKIINTLFYKTTPVYWGCKNIENYFPNMSIGLSGDVNKDIELLKNILRNPDSYKKDIDIDKVKQSTNFFSNIESIFSNV